MSVLKIAGGTVYDPANGRDGVVMDLWAENGVIVPADRRIPDRVIDANGYVVMPGGVDMHAHIAGPKVNYARKMRPEDRRGAPFPKGERTRSGTIGSTPSTFVTGYLYAGMGYTTVFDAAIPPLGARHTHEEFHDTPMIDKGFFVLLGNHHYALDRIRNGESDKLADFVGWILRATRGYAIKLVNPGGVEMWKAGVPGHAAHLDSIVPDFNITPRQVLVALAQAVMDAKLPHPMHLHCNQLGIPGNASTTLATMQALEGRRAHLTHIQFHSYGGDPDDQSTFGSRVPELVEYVKSHPNLTVDVGQILFGDTTSMTGDGPLGYYLHKVTGKKWFNADTELEAGCGIVPIRYRDKSFVHALQWAIGLEWYLLMDDPWRIGLSTDHPNGASFVSYPEIIKLLMDRDYRMSRINALPAKIRERSTLAELTRVYTLNEIAIITRAGPARMLGLSSKGHLGIGADADVTVYAPNADIHAMFSHPKYVVKSGRVIIENGEVRETPDGPVWCVEPAYDPTTDRDVAAWFAQYSSLAFANYPVDDFYLTHGKRVVPCRV